jgi:hypothetical protein
MVIVLTFFIFIGYIQSHPLNSKQQKVTPSPTPMLTSQPSVLGKQTKTSGCVALNGLPDRDCTPGAVFLSATKEQICTPGYTKKVRNVTSSTKEKIFASYGITSHGPGEYEVDHLIPLELGGSNELANLFPEAAEPRPGFHEKDQVENYLHDEVCEGRIALQDAQHKIASDWIAIYNQLPQ